MGYGVLINQGKDPSGFWINLTFAEALNQKDAEHMRIGFSVATFNSGAARWVDPTGKPEFELAEKYKKQADESDKSGHQRVAEMLRGMARDQERIGNRHVEEHKQRIDHGDDQEATK